MKKINNALYMLGYAARHVPGFFFWTIIEGLVWGCIHSFTSVLFVKTLFDKVENQAPFSEILTFVGVMALFLFFAYIFHEWYWKFLEPRTRHELHKRMQEKLFKKAASLDLACYDDPKFYTDFVWAINEADKRAIAVCEDMGKVINRVLSSTVILSVLFSVDLWIVAAICASVGFAVWLNMLRAKIQLKRDVQIKPIQRKADYIGRVHYLANYAKELRLSNAEDILVRDFDRSVRDIITIIKQYGRKMFLASFTRRFSLSMLFDVGVLILLVYKMMVEQSITLGDFGATLGAMWKLFWQINNLMDYLTKFKEHSLYAEKFRVFLAYKPTVCDEDHCVACNDLMETLELKNVSFAYPGSDKNIINNLSMSIKYGQKIALVGYNGAGKSTLVKLLLRLYDVSDGAILLNGEAIQNFTLESYQKKFGTVFQDFQLYAADIAENVLCDTYTADDEPRVQAALSNSGFDNKLAALPDGIHTTLTKEFDKTGTNLSGGEAQKIAIARIFAKPCDIVILDEPSSALDPISEYELNKAIMTAFDKTVVIISHRLSVTRMADVIYMLEDGEIIEQGNHNELMKLNGKYAEMFKKQAEKYCYEKDCAYG